MDALGGQEVQSKIAIFIAYEGAFLIRILPPLPMPAHDASGEDLRGLCGPLGVGERNY